MAIPTKVTIRGQSVKVPGGGSKANVARVLLDQGYTVSEISKAVPMAYSQVHSIAQKTGALSANADPRPGRGQDSRAQRERPTAVGRGLDHPRGSEALERPGASRASGRPARDARPPQPAAPQAHTRGSKSVQPQARQVTQGPQARPRVGNIRLAGRVQRPERQVGACANCKHDLVLRDFAGMWTLVHINITPEDYIRTIQFCQATPVSLL